MYTINPGEFKHKIELKEVKTSTDADNIPTKTLTTIWTTKSRVRNNIASSKNIDDGERTSITKIITTRFPKHLKLDIEDANRYKVLYNNRLYNVVSLSNIREENKYLQINIGAIE
ncbi:head-tail adaptor protein [Clostridium sp.]|uniref:phage head completion protein n=1 Tax=Clostridium sp. TaxID=1506 RepID=UPI003990ABA8